MHVCRIWFVSMCNNVPMHFVHVRPAILYMHHINLFFKVCVSLYSYIVYYSIHSVQLALYAQYGIVL